MYKVYILEKKIDIAKMPFCDEPTFGAIVFDQKGLDTTKMLKILQKNNSSAQISHAKAQEIDLESNSVLWLIEAAGGVVRREDDILMIFRNGCWDLPKGKLEEGENIEDCAAREVCEECGLEAHNLHSKGLIIQTLHAYSMYGKEVLKRTWWYEMEYEGSKELTPQIIEGITQASWLSEQQAREATAQSYGTILDVMKAYNQTNK